jgi:predicted DNA-binding protein YlxM (UPF0122 family)
MSVTKKLTDKQLLAIKKLYFEYMPVTQIAKKFKVSRSAINWHVSSNSWAASRKLQESEIFAAFDDTKKVDFVKMTQSAVAIMARSLQTLATRLDPPSIMEATKAADILKTLDNILRLDEGKPTDIVENQDQPLDDKALKKKLAKDPFNNIQEEEDNEIIN